MSSLTKKKTMAGFDYSKWDNIELSDDESDCHPNIDKDSWFRLKHRTRVEREAKEEEEKVKLEQDNDHDSKRVASIVAKLTAIPAAGAGAEEEEPVDREALEAELKDLQGVIDRRNERLEEMERNKKWNVDNMCHVVEERTIINPALGSQEGTIKDTMYRDPNMKEQADGAEDGAPVQTVTTAVKGPKPETQEVESYAIFTRKHENMLEEFSVMTSMEKSQQYLHENGDILLAEHAQSYLLLACLEDEMNAKHDRMKKVAHQSQILSSITELAASMDRHPRDVVIPFFKRVQEPTHLAGFQQAVDDFVNRIQKRAVDKRKEMDAEEAARQERGEGEETEEVELSREERLGPGGLDPVEVFESLPEEMQDAFESRDTQRLQSALMGMDPAQAQYHMKRCVDSGLWNPGPADEDEPPANDAAPNKQDEPS
uniref:Hsp90 chaperone protein kinase-targeting subunit n=1 Tax=Fibrocapsa japonica TaxID=94617 RepID=A0A7S2XXR3_9STRA